MFGGSRIGSYASILKNMSARSNAPRGRFGGGMMGAAAGRLAQQNMQPTMQQGLDPQMLQQEPPAMQQAQTPYGMPQQMQWWNEMRGDLNRQNMMPYGFSMMRGFSPSMWG